jgi:hypothetical protein
MKKFSVIFIILQLFVYSHLGVAQENQNHTMINLFDILPLSSDTQSYSKCLYSGVSKITPNFEKIHIETLLRYVDNIQKQMDTDTFWNQANQQDKIDIETKNNATWTVLLFVYKITDSEEIKKMILEYWNQSLKELHCRHLASQTHALASYYTYAPKTQEELAVVQSKPRKMSDEELKKLSTRVMSREEVEELKKLNTFNIRIMSDEEVKELHAKNLLPFYDFFNDQFFESLKNTNNVGAMHSMTVAICRTNNPILNKKLEKLLADILSDKSKNSDDKLWLQCIITGAIHHRDNPGYYTERVARLPPTPSYYFRYEKMKIPPL